MLRTLGIRSKILAVLALPVSVLVLAASVIAAGALSDARQAAEVESLAVQAAELPDLVRDLQVERLVTVATLSAAPLTEPLADVRARVDAGSAQLAAATDAADLDRLDDVTVDAYDRSAAAHEALVAVRVQVDRGILTPLAAELAFDEAIAADIALPAAIGDGGSDRRLALSLSAATATGELVESLVQERDGVAAVLAAGALTTESRTQTDALVIRTEVVREQTIEDTERAGIRTPVAEDQLGLERDAVANPVQATTAESYSAAVDADIRALTGGHESLGAAAGSRAAQLSGDASRFAWEVLVGALLLVVVPLVLALLLARRITRPLLRLTQAATQLRTELPAMVERMQTPGEGPDVTLPHILIESDDEIGRLATAFNDVNTTTIQVAQEQAALRGSIAAMFVNVARRDQKLLSRQLSFIDQLERTEENPETLENLFKLDHLATRMRRNAESLLVLAGIDTGRRLRRPMPLSDVVRTASSEIEHYERIDLSQRIDPPMLGHAALPLAHLLAELLENATSFSKPTSRVVVSIETGPRGVTITIADDGLGMSAEDLARANERIANPPVSEAVGAQHLGFFVVGRLARKLDVTVQLEARPVHGMLIRVEMPPALFAPGTVAEPIVVDDADEATPPVVGAVVPQDVAPGTRLAERLSADTTPAPARTSAVSDEPPHEPAAAPAADTDAPVDTAARSRGGLSAGFRSRHPGIGLRRPHRSAAAGSEQPTAAIPVAPSPVAPSPVGSSPVAPSPVVVESPAAAAPSVPMPAPPPAAHAAHAAPAAPPAPAAPIAAPPPERRPARAGTPSRAVRPGSDLPELAPSSPRPEGMERPVAGRPIVPVAAPAAPDRQAAHTPAVGASAMDILPGGARHRGGGRGRFGSRRKEAERAAARPLTALVLESPSAYTPAQYAPGVGPEPRPDVAATSSLARSAPADLGAGTDHPSRVVTSRAAVAAAAVPPVRTAPPATPLPTRTPTARSSGAVPMPIGDVLRQRSVLASDASTELGRASTHRPDEVPGTGPATPTRRRPGTPETALEAPQPVAPARRNRTATDVRAMLSGFQAGVQRGRAADVVPTEATAAPAATEPPPPAAADE